MEMKDRIRLVMEEQHMRQQVFADFVGLSAATLSSIFNGRTRPTLNIVEAIKKKIPVINTDWLLMGIGDMHIGASSEPVDSSLSATSTPSEPTLDFDSAVQDRAEPAYQHSYSHGVKSTRLDFSACDMKNIDRQPRKVTEIRVYYDDQTYETFVPAKSK